MINIRYVIKALNEAEIYFKVAENTNDMNAFNFGVNCIRNIVMQLGYVNNYKGNIQVLRTLMTIEPQSIRHCINHIQHLKELIYNNEMN